MKAFIINVRLNGGYAGKNENLKWITIFYQGKLIKKLRKWNDNESRSEEKLRTEQLNLSISSVSVVLPINSKYGMIT